MLKKARPTLIKCLVYFFLTAFLNHNMKCLEWIKPKPTATSSTTSYNYNSHQLQPSRASHNSHHQLQVTLGTIISLLLQWLHYFKPTFPMFDIYTANCWRLKTSVKTNHSKMYLFLIKLEHKWYVFLFIIVLWEPGLVKYIFKNQLLFLYILSTYMCSKQWPL